MEGGDAVIMNGDKAGGDEDTTQPNFGIVPPHLGSFAPLAPAHLSLTSLSLHPLHPSAADAAWQSLSLAAAAKANNLTCAKKKTYENLKLRQVSY